MKFDLIVIGAGPDGYVAAILAAQHGMNVAVVERPQLGGICLNWGCIPTKALLRSAEVYGYFKDSDKLGLQIERPGFDLAAIVARSDAVSQRLGGRVAGLLRKIKIKVIWGEASFSAANRLTVQAAPGAPPDALATGNYEADHFIVATGVSQRVLPGMEPGGGSISTYCEATAPKSLPASLFVIGTGAIGVNLAPTTGAQS